MNGHTYLDAALITAGVALALWIIGPLARRWHQRLERDLQRMKHPRG
jgi:hypothetical protein